jgi:hypothetical protein
MAGGGIAMLSDCIGSEKGRRYVTVEGGYKKASPADVQNKWRC